eukprot:scaffold37506_cov150-Skeletonema_dohrnii-CCMP3373.AAC.2
MVLTDRFSGRGWDGGELPLTENGFYVGIREKYYLTAYPFFIPALPCLVRSLIYCFPLPRPAPKNGMTARGTQNNLERSHDDIKHTALKSIDADNQAQLLPTYY